MKSNKLKFTVILLCYLLCNVSTVNAQDVLMATLQHGDETQIFHGATAFVKAHETAVDGDIITLSGGTFQPCDITKTVKIYGAGGFVQDADNNKYVTRFNEGDFKITLSETQSGLYIEGIVTNFGTIQCYGRLNEMTLKRCSFNGLSLDRANTLNCNISQCYIRNLRLDAHSKNLSISNSVFYNSDSNEADAVFFISNCIVLSMNATSAVIRNSIIDNRYKSGYVSYYNTVYTYSKYSNGDQMPSADSVMEHCYNLGPNFSLSTLFEEGTYYVIKDEWKNKFVDENNMPIVVGIYSGLSPFTNVPSNPQIISKEIAGQSDENGKLAVKVVVEAQK